MDHRKHPEVEKMHRPCGGRAGMLLGCAVPFGDGAGLSGRACRASAGLVRSHAGLVVVGRAKL